MLGKPTTKNDRQTAEHKTKMTRRSFVKATALGVTGMLVPRFAIAQAADDPDGEAERLWREAVAEAEAAGEAVYYDIPSAMPEAMELSGTYTTGYAEMPVNIAGSSDIFGAVAVYDVTTVIDTVYNAWLQSKTGKHGLSNMTYAYTRIDSGRTLVVYYTCTTTNVYTNISHVFTCYAEFYRNGSGIVSA